MQAALSYGPTSSVMSLRRASEEAGVTAEVAAKRVAFERCGKFVDGADMQVEEWR